MALTDPDIPSAQLLKILELLPDEVEEAIRGLDESAIDRSRAEGSWTIREIVHHIVDSASMATNAIRVAIATPGSRYDQSWYDMTNRWAETLHYRLRSIAPSLHLFRANCEYLIEMLQRADAPWEKEVVVCTERNPEGKSVGVRYMVRGMAWHVRHHCEQIGETRAVVGSWRSQTEYGEADRGASRLFDGSGLCERIESDVVIQHRGDSILVHVDRRSCPHRQVRR